MPQGLRATRTDGTGRSRPHGHKPLIHKDEGCTEQNMSGSAISEAIHELANVLMAAMISPGWHVVTHGSWGSGKHIEDTVLPAWLRTTEC